MKTQVFENHRATATQLLKKARIDSLLVMTPLRQGQKWLAQVEGLT